MDPTQLAAANPRLLCSSKAPPRRVCTQEGVCFGCPPTHPPDVALIPLLTASCTWVGGWAGGRAGRRQAEGTPERRIAGLLLAQQTQCSLPRWQGGRQVFSRPPSPGPLSSPHTCRGQLCRVVAPTCARRLWHWCRARCEGRQARHNPLRPCRCPAFLSRRAQSSGRHRAPAPLTGRLHSPPVESLCLLDGALVRLARGLRVTAGSAAVGGSWGDRGEGGGDAVACEALRFLDGALFWLARGTALQEGQ